MYINHINKINLIKKSLHFNRVVKNIVQSTQEKIEENKKKSAAKDLYNILNKQKNMNLNEKSNSKFDNPKFLFPETQTLHDIKKYYIYYDYDNVYNQGEVNNKKQWVRLENQHELPFYLPTIKLLVILMSGLFFTFPYFIFYFEKTSKYT